MPADISLVANQGRRLPWHGATVARTSFDRVQLLTAGFEEESLSWCQQFECFNGGSQRLVSSMLQIEFLCRDEVPTSVLIAKAGSHESGGIILHIPYFSPSGRIFLIYSIGSLNSSSVGLKVGASCKPCGLTFFLALRTADGCPRLSTVDRSKGGALR